MALIHGDQVVPAGTFNGTGTVADLSVGSLCPNGFNVGVLYIDGDEEDIVWNNGGVLLTGTYTPNNFRKCVNYTGTDLLGKSVALTGFGPAFRGTVVRQINVELGTTGGNGSETPVVVVKTAQFYYVALPASIEEIN